ncbi:MAG: hypothetical protein JW936_09810 [Sedimentisphaerales bacterium]|nr:hypothetical protein [Sedimentisphaerales bacterium]
MRISCQGLGDMSMAQLERKVRGAGKMPAIRSGNSYPQISQIYADFRLARGGCDTVMSLMVSWDAGRDG